MKIFNRAVAVSMLAAVMLQGCAAPLQNKSIDAHFKEGERLFRKGNYEEAIGQWKKVKEHFPPPGLAARTEINIADAYFLNKEYVEAAAEFETFRKLHPGHALAGYALYRQGLSSYMQIDGIDTDQTPVKNALSIFESYLRLYPGGANTAEVAEKIGDCRDKQLQYEVYVGRFYLRNGTYPAAIARLEEALKTFGDLPHRDGLLYYLGQAYLEGGRKPEGRQVYERLLQEFPASSFAPAAKKVVGKS